MEQCIWFQTPLSLGIGLGSYIAGQFSQGKIRYGFVPLGAGLMALGAIGMGLPIIEKFWFALFVAVLGFGGGLYIVPVAAVLQHRPKPENKGVVQGIASWLSWVGILGAFGVQTLLSSVCKLSHSQIFWFCGGVALVGGLYVGSSRLGWFSRKNPPHMTAQK